MQIMSFFQTLKFGYDVTKMTSSILKYICLYLHRKIDYDSKFGSSITFGLAVGQQRLFDTRWQILKAEKGEVPRPKHGDFFWWLRTWS